MDTIGADLFKRITRLAPFEIADLLRAISHLNTAGQACHNDWHALPFQVGYKEAWEGAAALYAGGANNIATVLHLWTGSLEDLEARACSRLARASATDKLILTSLCPEFAPVLDFLAGLAADNATTVGSEQNGQYGPHMVLFASIVENGLGGLVGSLSGARMAKRLSASGQMVSVFVTLIFVVAAYMLYRSGVVVFG